MTDKRDMAAMLSHALEIDFDELSTGCAICELIAEWLSLELVDDSPTHNRTDPRPKHRITYD